MAIIPRLANAQGEKVTLYAEIGPPAEVNVWTKYTIPLTAEAFSTESNTFQTLLSNVTSLKIRTEMADGPDVAGVDNVKIGTLYSSDFNIGLEKWNATGDGTVEWVSTGGVDGGYLQVADYVDEDFHYAIFPASWAGNWTALIGQNLEFYLKTNHPNYAARVEISNIYINRIVLSPDTEELLPGDFQNLRIEMVPPPLENKVINLTSLSNCVLVPVDVLYTAGAEYVNVEISATDTVSNCQSVIEITSDDYIKSRVTISVGERDPAEYAAIQGRVTDATTGLGIVGASVSIGDIYAITNETGYYSMENIPLKDGTANFHATPQYGEVPLFVQFQDLARVGYNYLEANYEGYYPYSTNMELPGGKTTVFDISISPRVQAGGLRFVLNWGESPLDLDLYLKTPFIEGSDYLIYWLASGNAILPPYATLDHDDQDGLGPETITINQLFDGTYKCYVENYSKVLNSDAESFTGSRSQVQIYNSSGLIKTVHVPTEGSGLYWYIGDIDGASGLLTIKNQLTDEVPGASGPLTSSVKKKPERASIEALASALDIVSWEWDLDGDGKVDSYIKNPTFTYSKAGKYTVSLNVSDGHTSFGETKVDYITVFATDTTPPGVITDFTANAVSHSQVDLSWTNPTDVDYLATIVMRLKGRFPENVGDGVYVYNSSGTGFSDTGLEADSTYFYSAFAYDGRYNYSDPGPTSTDSASTFPIIRQGLKVNINSFDLSGFGTVKAFASIVDSASLDPVTDLTKDHFSLYEDGMAETPITVEKVDVTSNLTVDIVFVIDVTGSMGPQINGLEGRIVHFADALNAKGLDYRLGLVAYDDTVKNTWNFTDNVDLFKAWVSGIKAEGGGDLAENALEGLARAASFGFRPNAQKYTILITDQTFHEIHLPGSGATQYSTETMVELLAGKGIVNYVVGPDLQKMQQLAEGTGGLYFDITQDFAATVDLIGNIISNQYVISYDSHNSVVNNTWRNIQLDINEDIKFGTDLGRYYIGNKINNVTGFKTIAISASQIIGRWINPGDSTFNSVVVCKSQTGFPTLPMDGTIVYSGMGPTFLDGGLDPNTIYYYSAFACNSSGIYADYSEGAVDAARTYVEKDYIGEWTTSLSGTEQNLLAVITIDSINAIVSGENGTFLQTANSGKSWSQQTLATGATLSDMLFYNTTNGFVVGMADNGNGAVWRTTDSGAVWESQSPPLSFPINAIAGVDNNNIWAVTNQGGMIKMAPDAGGWQTLNTGIAENILALCFANKNTGWIAGEFGVLYKTTNAGAHWTKQESNISSNITDLFFITDQTGWLIGQNGKVCKTINGGNTWTMQKLTDYPLSSIHFSDPLNGFTVGEKGVLFSTNDGGVNWTLVNTRNTNNLNDVFALSPHLGWAVGDAGTILKLVREDDYSKLSGYQVNINSINTEAFPTIKSFVSVVDTLDKVPVIGLLKDYFTVSEEGESLSDFTLEGLSSTSAPRADINFVFDITGSMGAKIETLKDRVVHFADGLAAKGIDYRFGLVTFSDDIEAVYDFTFDVSEFKNWVAGLNVASSGDVKENALKGLERSLESSWRAAALRYAILVTDQDYHKAGETGNGITNQTTFTIIDSLVHNSIILNTVAPNLPQFYSLAKETGGMWFDITGDFNSTIENIGEIISSQYVLTFNSPNMFADNSKRKVDVTAQMGAKSGHDRGTYFIGTSRLAMDPAEVIGLKDDVFTVNIQVENILDLGLVHFIVNWDATKINVLEGQVGDFLKQSGGSVIEVTGNNNAAGKFELDLTRVASTGASGTGVLYTLKFHILVKNCSSTISLEATDLRKLDDTAIPVTVGGLTMTAADAVPGGILADFDNDLDIDLRDFSLLATFWKPTNGTTGDIGPASGAVPSLSPVKDGIVNYEDLFVFTRMWNWYNESRESFDGGLLKGFANLEWRVLDEQSKANVIRLELWAHSVERLSMGHLLLEYDDKAMNYKSARAGDFLTRDKVSSAFLVETNSNKIDISMARLPQKGQQASSSGSGVIAVFEFERTTGTDLSCIKVTNADFRTLDNANISVGDLGDLVLNGTDLPTSYALSQNYPNPFNNHTQLQFSLPQTSRVRMTVMNLLGQPVRTLALTEFEAGMHRIVWDGKNDYGREVAGGIYLIQMEAGAFKQTREMLFLK